MQYPGRNHFKLLLHFLRHLQCYRLNGGIKFYSEIAKSPLYRHLTTTGNGKHADYPIVCISDASFQDCPDSGRFSGGYLIFMQGAVVDTTSTMPQLVAWSTCEAEYCMGALATMGAFYYTKGIKRSSWHRSRLPTSNSNWHRFTVCNRHGNILQRDPKDPTFLPQIRLYPHCSFIIASHFVQGRRHRQLFQLSDQTPTSGCTIYGNSNLSS
jgi:hypothetical protein